MDAPQQGNFVLCHLYDGKMISPRTMASRYCSLNAKPCTENKAKNKIGAAKGQLILKGHLGVFKFTKNQRNFCKDFCPSLKKRLNQKK